MTAGEGNMAGSSGSRWLLLVCLGISLRTACGHGAAPSAYERYLASLNDCGPDASPTPIDAAYQTPVAGQAYHDALVRYFTNRSKVTYRVCARNSQFYFTGEITWVRDGPDRERLDLKPDAGVPVSYIASRTTSYICSSKLGEYVSSIVEGSDADVRGEFKSLKALGAACLPDPPPYGSCDRRCLDDAVIDGLGAPNPLTIDLDAYRAMSDTPGPTFTYARQIAGERATCFFDECFGDDGTLLSLAGNRSTLTAQVVSHEVSDADFALPFAAAPTPMPVATPIAP